MKHRIGTFRTTREMLFSKEAPTIFAAAKIVPLKIEWEWTGIATITALSPLFEESEECMVSPVYEMQIETAPDGELKVKALRV